MGLTHLTALRVGPIGYESTKLNFGDSFSELEFLELADVRASRRVKGVTATTIRVGNEQARSAYRIGWISQPTSSNAADDIIKALLNRAERALRVHAQLEFERRVERRKELQAQLAACAPWPTPDG